MNINSAFKSNYLKHSDLNGKRVLVTMERVEVETIGQGRDAEEKPILYFEGHDKGLVLNKTNAFTIADIIGSEDTDHWSGKRIVLFQDKTMFQGKPTACIRVAAPPAGNVKSSRSAPPPPPVETDEELVQGFVPNDDDVPF